MAELTVQVTLCWSLGPRHVQEISLAVPERSTVEAALEQCMVHWGQSQVAADASILSSLKFHQPGIWGRQVPWTQEVQAGDRIELYRPLKVDPKVARRQRFKRQGKGRTGLFANRKSGSAAGY
ncbi:RnfH family protein [Limnohabitans sp. 15K]|uniref:RnfH family protein n=1 Tax=Limnohabitans sp. 15K TaxID=1100706 RepID=UPI000C1E58C0|nr:RnfH family protein [Limnohabitans sp. 15K]PIT82282.1 RnfH family protein [Limnohabitans sp. 15K]